MKIQILHAFTIQSQPRLDICVFSVARSGIRISLLDLSCAVPVDLRKHWLERHRKNRALRSAPAAPVGQWFGELEDLTRQFHSENRLTVVQPLMLPPMATSDDVHALQPFHDFPQMLRTSVNDPGVKLNQCDCRL